MKKPPRSPFASREAKAPDIPDTPGAEHGPPHPRFWTAVLEAAANDPGPIHTTAHPPHLIPAIYGPEPDMKWRTPADIPPPVREHMRTIRDRLGSEIVAQLFCVPDEWVDDL